MNEMTMPHANTNSSSACDFQSDCLPESNPSLISTKRKKLLIITSSGGGGLIQAANAKEQEALVNDPNLLIIRRDLLRDWMGKWVGESSTNLWNRAQLKGDVAAQKFFAWAQLAIAEYIFWPNVFFHALSTFFKEDIDEIIDTQCLGTSAILAALRIFNRSRKKQVKVQKVLVDLPTKKATHFFHPIKKLSKKNRSLLQLIAIPPLLDEGQTAEEFWQEHCRLSEKEVHCGDVYVRQGFKKLQGKTRPSLAMSFKLKVKSGEELFLMKRTFERGPIRAQSRENEVEFKVGASDRMYTLLLGSNPANQSTFNYVKNLIPLAKHSKQAVYLFVFCADHKPGDESLFRKIAELVESCKEYPEQLSIIPFSFQSDEEIAPLFFRSDATCTRSGGQTAMELMCVSTGEIWIHSEAKKSQGKELTQEDLLKGIPGWESESAVYLQKKWRAKITTPETFNSLFLDSVQANG